MNIAEIRQKYPQYNDLSDQQLIDGLHDKHYADIPKADFYSKVGFVQPKESGDEKKQSSQGKFMQGVDSFNEAVRSTGLPALATGFMEGGQNALANMVNFGSEIAGSDKKIPLANYGMDSPAKSVGNVIGAGSTYFMPGAAINAAKIPQGIRSFVNAVPEVANALSKSKAVLSAIPGAKMASSPIVTEGLKGALFGASQMPDNRLMGTLTGFAGPAAFEAGMAAKPLNALFRPQATQAEVQKTLNALPPELRDQVPVGELVNSSPLRNAQTNVLQNIPGSGMGVPYERLNKYIVDEGDAIFNDLLKGRSTQNIPREIYDSTKKNYEGIVKQTNKAYEDFRSAAKKENVNFNASPLEKSIDSKISNFKSEIERNPRRKDEYSPIISALDDYKKTLTGKIPQKESAIIDEHGKNFVSPEKNKLKINNFDDAERFRVDLNKDYEKAYNDKNFEFTRTIRSIKNDLDKSMEESVVNNENLKGMLKEARDLYKKQLPFREGISQKGKEADTTFFNNYMTEKSGRSPNLDNFVNESLITGKNKDASDTLSNLLNLLPDKKSKDLVSAYYLKDAVQDGKINPSKLMTAYQKLGPNQRKLLFPELNDRFGKLETISRTYPDLFGINYNPKTGQQAAKLLPYGFGSSAAATGYALGGPLGGVAGAAAVPALGYVGRKLATSPTVRNALLDNRSLIGKDTKNALNALYLGALADTGGK
jgi:hypothetical protein